MPCISVAHVSKNGTNLILVPPRNEYANLTIKQKEKVRETLQTSAQVSNLAGTVLLAISVENGLINWFGPEGLAAHIQGLTLDDLQKNLNAELVI